MTSRLVNPTSLAMRRIDFSLRRWGERRRVRRLNARWLEDGPSVDIVGSFLAIMKLFVCGTL